jgi:hypothetical protein
LVAALAPFAVFPAGCGDGTRRGLGDLAGAEGAGHEESDRHSTGSKSTLIEHTNQTIESFCVHRSLLDVSL